MADEMTVMAERLDRWIDQLIDGNRTRFWGSPIRHVRTEQVLAAAYVYATPFAQSPIVRIVRANFESFIRHDVQMSIEVIEGKKQVLTVIFRCQSGREVTVYAYETDRIPSLFEGVEYSFYPMFWDMNFRSASKRNELFLTYWFKGGDLGNGGLYAFKSKHADTVYTMILCRLVARVGIGWNWVIGNQANAIVLQEVSDIPCGKSAIDYIPVHVRNKNTFTVTASPVGEDRGFVKTKFVAGPVLKDQMVGIGVSHPVFNREFPGRVQS